MLSEGFAVVTPCQLAPSMGTTLAGSRCQRLHSSATTAARSHLAKTSTSRDQLHHRGQIASGRPILFVAIEFITACKSPSRGESYRSTRWHARARLPTSWRESLISGSPKQQSRHDLSTGRRQQAAFGVIQSTQCMVRSTRYECVRVLLLGDQSFDQGS